MFDEKGDVIAATEIPMIAGGTAVMLLTTFEGNALGGGINLQGVQLLEIDEYVGNTGVDEDALQAKLRNL